MNPLISYTIGPLGQTAWLVRLDANITAETSATIGMLADELRRIPGTLSVVAGYTEIAVHFQDVESGMRILDHCDHVMQAGLMASSIDENRIVREISVTYGKVPPETPEGGRWVQVNLDELAERVGMPVNDLIQRHTAPCYTVAMIGFLPGFPYLLGLDPSLRLPRRKETQRVVPGIVAIADWQAGVYSAESEGGWHALGYCDPCEIEGLQAGDRVQFKDADA